jgi:hypothetical protein
VQLSLPEQRAIPGVDTRPGPLRTWLTGLPYVDSENAAELIIERLRDINHQLIPSTHRLELLAAFCHSYERQHDVLRTSIRLQDALTEPRALHLLTNLTEAMSFGYKYALRDAINERQRWSRIKQLSEATNYSQYFLALLLICRYQTYQPVSDNSWKEIGDLVRFAEAQPLTATPDLGFPCCSGDLHVLKCYKQLALLRLADPYRLPTNMIWEIYCYLSDKTGMIKMLNSFDDTTPTGVYGLSLDREPQQSLPAPASGVERNSWRWLDARELLQTVQQDIERISAGTQPHRLGFSQRVSSNDGTQLLSRLLSQWAHAHERKSPRFNSNVDVDLTLGLEAAYYFLNNCRAFNPAHFSSPDDDDDIDYTQALRIRTNDVQRDFRLISCPTRNRSSGGLALHLDEIHNLILRVGQLVLISIPGTGTTRDWLVGVVRWQVSGKLKHEELGVQYVARNSHPAVVRQTSGAHQLFRPALKSDLALADGQRLLILITPRGFYKSKAVLELQLNEQIRQIRCGHLLETGQGFERFSYEILDRAE